MTKNVKRSFAERLDLLAQVAVKVGLRPTPGQQIILPAPVEALPLVRRIVEHAYKEGASLVTPLLSDSECVLMRYQHGHDDVFDTAAKWLYTGLTEAYSNNAAKLAITGAASALFSAQDPAKISRAAKADMTSCAPVMELIFSGAFNWSLVPSATPQWANVVFPHLPKKQAISKLWDAIFQACRVDVADPVAAWGAHNKNLHARRDFLNAKRYAALRFRGPGTNLIVRLSEDHLWAGGSGTAQNGIKHNANIPTEEVYTTPHCRGVEGYVTSTKPLSLHGVLVEGIRVDFIAGKAVSVKAKKGQEVLEKLVQTDEGAAYLGEVALVPHSSPISQSGLLFCNTLFDENAASHIAFGQSFPGCTVNGHALSKDELVAKGSNHSNVHVDWMIGSGEVDIDGITADLVVESVMRRGEWAIDI